MDYWTLPVTTLIKAATLILTATGNSDGKNFLDLQTGDEFIIIPPGTGMEGAVFVAEKIREIIQDSAISTADDKTVKFTLSLGVASHKKESGSFEEIISEADEMLYLSKKKGRNRVTSCE